MFQGIIPCHFFGRSTPHHLKISSKLALSHYSVILKSPKNLNSISLQLRKLCLFEILLVFPNRVYLLADNLDEILREKLNNLRATKHF